MSGADERLSRDRHAHVIQRQRQQVNPNLTTVTSGEPARGSNEHDGCPAETSTSHLTLLQHRSPCPCRLQTATTLSLQRQQSELALASLLVVCTSSRSTLTRISIFFFAACASASSPPISPRRPHLLQLLATTWTTCGRCCARLQVQVWAPPSVPTTDPRRWTTSWLSMSLSARTWGKRNRPASASCAERLRDQR